MVDSDVDRVILNDNEKSTTTGILRSSYENTDGGYPVPHSLDSSDGSNLKHAADNEKVDFDNDVNETEYADNYKNGETETDEEDPRLIVSNGAHRMNEFMKYIYEHKHKNILLALFFIFIYLIEWAYAFCFSVTTSLSPLATSSYASHSQGLASTDIATTIISAVCRPFLAKLADNASRPICYIVVIFFVMIGNIIVASSTTISAYVVGAGVASVGTSGVDFINSLIIADISPLKWRGFSLAMLQTPYIYNAWFTPLVVTDLNYSNWRWGYGMFAIMVTILSIPIITLLMVYEYRAMKFIDRKKPEFNNVMKKIWEGFLEIDGFGLLLLGFGFTIILLPLSLYATAKDEWRNPSIIAMFIVGGFILIFFLIFEYFFSPYPIMPKKVWNRTLLCCVSCDFFYQLSTQTAQLYFTSYTYVVCDLTTTQWGYLNNAISVSMCFFAVITGLLHRLTHRYKMWQIFGFVIQIIANGLLVQTNHQATISLGRLAAYYTLSGMGSGFATTSAEVALQASVPHKDLGISISFMSLFSNVGAAIGYAIGAVIWEGKMYNALRNSISTDVTDDIVLSMYGSIYVIAAYPFGTTVRDQAINAYQNVNFYLYAIELGLGFIPFIIVFFQSNYYLGDTQNAVEDSDTGESIDEEPFKTGTVKNGFFHW